MDMNKVDKKIKQIVTTDIEEPLKYKLTIEKALQYENIKKYQHKKIIHTLVSTAAGIFLTCGVVFATSTVYEKIWKEPERITYTENQIEEHKIAEENITEEQAKIIAQDKLVEFKIEEEIINTNHYTIPEIEEKYYRFLTKNWAITIKGLGGKFFDLTQQTYDKNVEKYEMTKQEAISCVKEYYKALGFKEGEYTLRKIMAQNKEGTNNKGYRFDAEFYKEYDGLYSDYESVSISIYAKDKALSNIRVYNDKCDNNPIKVTKEQAIDIATKEDRKVENSEIMEKNAELRIEKMNGNAYARLNNTEEYYKPMTTTDIPMEDRVAYKTDNRVRKVWVVVLKYGEGKVQYKGENLTQEQETDNLMNRYVKGQYSYFVDATTGEIIGGDIEDYLQWDNLWTKEYAVD